MWIFTKYGFFSAVCAHKEESKQPDVDQIMIRARIREHLRALTERFPALDEPIRDSTGTDYKYRVITTKAKWVEILTQLGEEIDYSNFKSEVAATRGHDNYEQSLHKVWSVMHSLQK